MWHLKEEHPPQLPHRRVFPRTSTGSRPKQAQKGRCSSSNLFKARTLCSCTRLPLQGDQRRGELIVTEKTQLLRCTVHPRFSPKKISYALIGAFLVQLDIALPEGENRVELRTFVCYYECVNSVTTNAGLGRSPLTYPRTAIRKASQTLRACEVESAIAITLCKHQQRALPHLPHRRAFEKIEFQHRKGVSTMATVMT